MRTWLEWLGLVSAEETPYISQDNDIEQGVQIHPEAASPFINAPEIGPGTIVRSLGGLIGTTQNMIPIAKATALTGISITLNFFFPYLLGKTINAYSNEGSESSLMGLQISTQFMIPALGLTYALSQFVPNLRDQTITPVISRTTQQLLNQISQHMLTHKSLNYHKSTSLADKIYRLQKAFSVASTVPPLLTQGLPIFVEIMSASTFLSTQYGTDIGLSLATTFVLYTGYSIVTTNPIIKARERMLKTGTAAWESIEKTLTQYENIHDFGQVSHITEQVDHAIQEAVDSEINAINKPLQINLGHNFISGLFFTGGLLLAQHNLCAHRIDLPAFVTLIGYLTKLCTLLPGFGNAVNQISASYPDLKFVLGELSIPSQVPDRFPDVQLHSQHSPEIRFENITFAYPDKKDPVFQNLSFTINPGQRVVLVSESGAGKSTIFSLLYRYYIPDSGSILINGQNIQGAGLESLRSAITPVRQKPNLFNGTIRENIKRGAPNPDLITDADIMTAADRAGLTEFIAKLPEGLDTPAGENGDKLSGGQQQKVAILRSFFKQSSILLLDEITSGLDNQSAREVLSSIEKRWRDDSMTLLMITHKLAEITNFDKIIVLGDKRVLAEGTHEELLDSCDLYRTLWESQSHSDNTTQLNTKPLR